MDIDDLDDIYFEINVMSQKIFEFKCNYDVEFDY